MAEVRRPHSGQVSVDEELIGDALRLHVVRHDAHVPHLVLVRDVVLLRRRPGLGRDIVEPCKRRKDSDVASGLGSRGTRRGSPGYAFGGSASLEARYLRSCEVPLCTMSLRRRRSGFPSRGIAFRCASSPMWGGRLKGGKIDWPKFPSRHFIILIHVLFPIWGSICSYQE